MPALPPPARPQTIKQAKAAYKSRGRPSLTDQEKRQLERAAELDRRAWRSKEAEKKKAEAARKKAEKDRKEREERQRLQMSSQRRCDRFGYKSSQMHLGAFLNRTTMPVGEQKGNIQTAAQDSESESFGDDDMDDESLLQAMDGTNEPKTADITPLQARSDTIVHASQQHRSTNMQHSDTTLPLQAIPDLDSFWDELDSSTQIARELESAEPAKEEQNATSLTRSFGSDDFDLTVEDIEELDSTSQTWRKLDEDRKLMPPPPLPAKPAVVEHGFTMSELERFVEDDLFLTQADPV